MSVEKQVVFFLPLEIRENVNNNSSSGSNGEDEDDE